MRIPIKHPKCTLWLIVSFAFLVIPCVSFAAGKKFPVFDALLYKNKPDLSQSGLQPLRVVYTGELWSKGASKDQPDVATVASVAKKLDPNVLVCLDIEHWPTHKAELVDVNIKKLKTEIAAVRTNNAKVKIGFYGVLPIRDYTRATGERGVKAYQDWQHQNDRLKPLANSIDAVFPSLYTFSNDPKNWEKAAIENIKEAKRYGKPVYVFLWPMFHDISPLKGQYIPADFWRLQLETCRKYADGVVIWGGYKMNWDEKAPWWLELKKFMSLLK